MAILPDLSSTLRTLAVLCAFAVSFAVAPVGKADEAPRPEREPLPSRRTTPATSPSSSASPSPSASPLPNASLPNASPPPPATRLPGVPLMPPMTGRRPATLAPGPDLTQVLGLPPASATMPGTPSLRIFVLTMSPGDHPFFKFGHNAIWIHDDTQRLFGRDKVYNWGTFAFGDPALIPKFVLGRFMYWLSVQSMASTLFEYERQNRSIVAQELDLDEAQKYELQRLVELNALPENSQYKYDYYRDNCSTRVRDLIDRVTGGRVREATKGPARLTYRAHTLRLTESLAPEYVALNLVMGDLIDKPITQWDEAFIPMELQKALSRVTLVDAAGKTRPLVRHEKLVVRAKRIAPPEEPPTWWPYSLCLGLLAGALFAFAGWSGRRHALARVVFGSWLSLWGLIAGFWGLFFLAAWAFTDHEVGYRNENVLLCVPWGLWWVGTGIRIARGRVASIASAPKLLGLTAALAFVAIALKLLPWFDQANGFFLVFFAPLWVGAYLGARVLAASQATRTAP